MKKMRLRTTFILVYLMLFTRVQGAVGQDTIRLDLKSIYTMALDANIHAALPLVRKDPSTLSMEDRAFQTAFESRFGHEKDDSPPASFPSPIDSLLLLYKAYWRMSLLDTAANYDSSFLRGITAYLASACPSANIQAKKPLSSDAIDQALNTYITSLHLYTTGFGKTGRLFDLLVWRNQKDTLYRFSLSGDTTRQPVVFMDDFITLGWEQYATLGRYYPGGWTTSASLFCVRQAYDLQSEDFQISYLAHESRHYTDKQLFPRLQSADLEYRAKLTELSLARVTLLNLIDTFISSANYHSGNGHNVADHCVIRDLSNALFNSSFEKDMDKWRLLDGAAINQAAAKQLAKNTRILRSRGKSVTHYIK
jgi:hypothetical protein